MEWINPIRMNCFFLLTNEPTVGSRMEMEVTLPREIAGSVAVKVLLRGEVVEIDREKMNGRIGVNCLVEKYRLVPDANDARTPTINSEESSI